MNEGSLSQEEADLVMSSLVTSLGQEKQHLLQRQDFSSIPGDRGTYEVFGVQAFRCQISVAIFRSLVIKKWKVKL